MKTKGFSAGMMVFFFHMIVTAHAGEWVRASADSYFLTTGFENKTFKAETPDVQVVTAPAAPAAPAGPAQVLTNIPVGNFGTVDLGDLRASEDVLSARAYRGGSLDNEDAYRFMGVLGVNSVINLQSSHLVDQTACAKFGLNCRDFSVLPFDNLSLTKSGDFQDAFKFAVSELKAGNKIYIHCMKGKDRTGALAAALMIRGHACGKDFDKIQLKAKVEESLDKHHFWRHNYPKWLSEIRGWVDDFDGNKDWLCR